MKSSCDQNIGSLQAAIRWAMSLADAQKHNAIAALLADALDMAELLETEGE